MESMDTYSPVRKKLQDSRMIITWRSNTTLTIRLIAYKKISEKWFEKKNNEIKNESDNETEEPVVKKLTKLIKH